jgi:molecular chaperone Hsp33
MERVQRFVSKDFSFRVALIEATLLIEEQRKSRNLSPLVTLGLGRCMMGALLMASHLKDGQGVGVLFRGDGPLEKLYSEAYYDGTVRAYCPNPHYMGDGSKALDLKKALGSGTITVARHQPFQKAPFQGTVELVSSEISEDIAHYLFQSQQIRSIISLGVLFNDLGQVTQAAGVLVEVMPGVESSLIESFEKHIARGLPSITQLFSEGNSGEKIVEAFVGNHEVSEIPHDYPIQYACPCSKERVLNAMMLWGEDGIKEMLKDKTGETATCQMCGERYHVTEEDLKEILTRIKKESMH